MKKVLATTVLGAVLAMSISTASHASTPAQTTPPTPPASPTTVPTPAPTGPPVQGEKRSILMYVDTVQGSGGIPKPAVGCSQTNLFRRGQVVVFRMWGVNVKLGGVALTPKNVASATVIIPGLTAPLTLVYGTHPSKTSFWSAAWFTKPDTTLGVVDFTIVVKTKTMTIKVNGKKKKIKPFTSKFTQQGLAETSRLTITV